MNRLHVLSALALSICTTIATASSGIVCPEIERDSPLRNVSSAGWATREHPVTVCTIVDKAYFHNNRIVVIMAESEDGDAELSVVDAVSNRIIAIRDDWLHEQRASAGIIGPIAVMTPAKVIKNLYAHPRLPKRTSDALVMLGAPTDSSSGLSAICAVGYPKQARAWVSVSITRDTFACLPELGSAPPKNEGDYYLSDRLP